MNHLMSILTRIRDTHKLWFLIFSHFLKISLYWKVLMRFFLCLERSLMYIPSPFYRFVTLGQTKCTTCALCCTWQWSVIMKSESERVSYTAYHAVLNNRPLPFFILFELFSTICLCLPSGQNLCYYMKDFLRFFVIDMELDAWIFWIIVSFFQCHSIYLEIETFSHVLSYYKRESIKRTYTLGDYSLQCHLVPSFVQVDVGYMSLRTLPICVEDGCIQSLMNK